MAECREMLLGNGWHTLYSDEVWYLMVSPNSGEIILEARFQSDAPDRTGYPNWARTEFCISKAGDHAVCRIPFAGAAELLAASRLSFVPEDIWRMAAEKCRTLMVDPDPSNPDAPPDSD